MDEIETYPTHKPNHTRYRITLWLGGIGAPFVLLYLLLPNCGDRQSAQSTTCLSNLKQQALAINQYVKDYDGELPVGVKWIDQVYPYIKNDGVFQCPELTAGRQRPSDAVYGYAYNSLLSGAARVNVANTQNMVLTYDSTSRLRNRSDPFTSIPTPGRHKKGDSVSFLDGHAKHISDNNMPALQEQVKNMKLTGK